MVKQTIAGNWMVTSEVQARKMVVDSKGAETGIPLNDLI